MTVTNLDASFGDLVSPAGRLRPGEDIHVPSSLIEVTHSTADPLIRFMKSVEVGHYLNCFHEREFTLLWVVSETGALYVSLEEAVADDPPASTFPLPKRVKNRHMKLGHPALLRASPGRIAGELYYDDPHWIIDTNSGRYSYNLNRTEAQLDNVARKFSTCGIQVETDFL